MSTTEDPEELQRDFKVLGFALGCCVVIRRSDGQKGSLQFTHQPRLYFGFVAHEEDK